METKKSNIISIKIKGIKRKKAAFSELHPKSWTPSPTYEVQFFMAKYPNEFKLKVVKYHLQGHGVKQTAKVFSLNHATVRKWASRYILHGEEGINRRTGTTAYSLDFKLNAIRMVMHEGLSQKETCARLNLPTDSILAQWLHRYRQHGIDGLRPKQKGRKSVKQPEQPETAKKADHLKTKEEMMEELLYLRAEMAVLKKLDALIREKEVRQKERKPSQD
ncbi:transposase [Neisseria dentiae]|nr:transposase [Neisseria dentiae]STZ49921.1 transposase [Neisseria dentiae]